MNDAVREALRNLTDLTECHCDVTYTDRGRHAAQCAIDYREDVDILAEALGGRDA